MPRKILYVVCYCFPILFGLEVRRLIGAMLAWAKDESGSQSTTPRSGQIIVVGSDEANLLGIEHERFDGPQIGFRGWLIGLRYLSSENGVPEQTSALRYVQHQSDIAVGQRSDDEAPLQTCEARNCVRPGIEAVPSEVEVF